jgi:hypothetical protein
MTNRRFFLRLCAAVSDAGRSPGFKDDRCRNSEDYLPRRISMHVITFMTMLVLSLCSVAGSASQQEKQTPKTVTISEKIQNLTHLPGFIPLHWDDKEGKILLEVRQFDTEFVYVESLATGIGSNDIGIDRGQLGANLVLKFQRSGPRVLLVQPNYSYRAVSPNVAERRAVEESFAQSVLWDLKSLPKRVDRSSSMPARFSFVTLMTWSGD